MVQTAHGSQNIFNITRPARYRCQVHHYHRKLSRLYLSVFQGQREMPAFYLLFSDVAYIDAPMSWQGADFAIADKDECITLMLKLGLVGPAIHQFPDAYAAVTDYARLYTAAVVGGARARIIAGSGALLQSIPAELR